MGGAPVGRRGPRGAFVEAGFRAVAGTSEQASGGEAAGGVFRTCLRSGG